MSTPVDRRQTGRAPTGAEPFLIRLAHAALTIPADDFAPHVALRLMTVAVMLEMLTPNGHARTTEDIATATGMTAEQVQFALDRMQAAPLPLVWNRTTNDASQAHILTDHGLDAHDALSRLMRVLDA